RHFESRSLHLSRRSSWLRCENRAPFISSGSLATPGICPVDTLTAPPDQGVAARNEDGEHQPRLAAERQRACNVSGHQAAHAEKKWSGVPTMRAATAAGVYHAGCTHRCQHGDPHDGTPYRIQQQCQQHCHRWKSPEGSKRQPIGCPILLLATLSIAHHATRHGTTLRRRQHVPAGLAGVPTCPTCQTTSHHPT